jgi:histidine triad (HIT) family protein
VPAPDPDCLFCKIVAGDLSADVVRSTDTAVAFRDVNPQAPTHVLVVPREHHANVAALAAADPSALAGLVALAADVAATDRLDGDYRLVFNTGPGAGQSVFHVHLHLLGGRPMTWPPG